MTQFSGKSAFIAESSQQDRVRANDENSHENTWAVSYPGQQVPDQAFAASPSTRTYPSHKPSHQTFLNWVAFNRSFAPNIHEIERRTCPLLGCEQCFDSLEDMLEHIRECPRLSKGLYRCFESGKEERIGRCETLRCQELQQCKDRIVNSLKRRLSPRGCGPRRPAGIPLERLSLSPEMETGMNKPFPVGVAELSCENALPPPAYAPMYFGSFQSTPAELGSGDYSESAVPPHFLMQYQFAELDSGEDCAGFSPDYLSNMQSEPAELADIPYTPHDFAHYRYGIAELSTDDNVSYGANNHILTRQHRPDCSRLSYSKSQESPRDWHQNVSISSSPLPNHYYGDFGQLPDEKAHSFGSSASGDMIETTPQSPPSGYPTRHYVPSMSSGASTDDSWGTSGFSAVSTLPSRDTSISETDPGKAAVGAPHGQNSVFFDESSRLFSEPDETEPLFPPSTQLLDEFLNATGSWNTQLDSGASLKDINGLPPSYIAGVIPQECMQPPHDHFQISRKPVPPPAPGTEQSSPTYCPEIKYSPRSQQSVRGSSYSTEVSSRAVDECSYCGRPIPDKSNLKRHEWNCKKNPAKLDKRYTCRFPDCGKRYTRSDALRVHQKGKGHQGLIDIFY